MYSYYQTILKNLILPTLFCQSHNWLSLLRYHQRINSLMRFVRSCKPGFLNTLSAAFLYVEFNNFRLSQMIISEFKWKKLKFEILPDSRDQLYKVASIAEY
jgi:hypothetical protein